MPDIEDIIWKLFIHENNVASPAFLLIYDLHVVKITY